MLPGLPDVQPYWHGVWDLLVVLGTDSSPGSGRKRVRAWILLGGVLSLALAGGAGFYIASKREPASSNQTGGERGLDRLTYHDYLEATGRSGLAPRTYSPANETLRNYEGGWLIGGRMEAVAAAESPVDVDSLAANDPARWRPLQEWKMQHGGMTEFGRARQSCMLEKLKGRLEGRPCDNKLIVVLERSEDGDEGKVVYVRPQLADDVTDGCREYSECVAKEAWIGRKSPLPAGSDTHIALHSGDLLFPFEGTEDERRRMLESDVNQMKAQLSALEESGDPAASMNISLLEDMIDFHEWLLSQAS